MSAIVLIPARMASRRLPGKPLATIAGEAMIVHVWRSAVAAGIGPVVVAAGDEAIAQAVREAGGEAVATDPALPSGTDRIAAALAAIDPGRRYRSAVNLQGDLPGLDPASLATVLAALDEGGGALATLVAESRDEASRDDPAVVKAVVAWNADGALGRALYFTRSAAPAGDGPLWHHVGLYAWRREALERFVALSPSPLERRESLEQLRALEAGMTVAVARIAAAPLAVDTPADLARARDEMAPSTGGRLP